MSSKILSLQMLGRRSLDPHLGAMNLVVFGMLAISCVAGSAVTECDVPAKFWVTDQKMKWEDAYEFCSNRTGTLPVLISACVNDRLSSLSTAEIWTAGTRKSSYSGDDEIFMWAVNSSLRIPFYSGVVRDVGSCLDGMFCNWRSGQPGNTGGDQKCIVINRVEHGKWADKECGFEMTVACEFTECPADLFTMGNTSCVAACPSGTYVVSEERRCVSVCPAGSFVSGSSCVVCPAGSFSNVSGSSSCTCCAAGFYSPGGATMCTACADGTYSNAGAGRCDACPVGRNRSSGCTSVKYWDTNLTMNWTDANSYCAKHDGTLPMLLNHCINERVSLFSQSNRLIWTAGSRLKPFSNDSNQFQWKPGVPFYKGVSRNSGGSCLSYCNFGNMDPNYGTTGEIQECIGMGAIATYTPQQWFDYGCSQKLSVICELVSCPQGYVASQQGTCVPCPPGMYSSIFSPTSCLPCPRRSKLRPGSNRCSTFSASLSYSEARLTQTVSRSGLSAGPLSGSSSVGVSLSKTGTSTATASRKISMTISQSSSITHSNPFSLSVPKSITASRAARTMSLSTSDPLAVSSSVAITRSASLLVSSTRASLIGTVSMSKTVRSASAHGTVTEKIIAAEEPSLFRAVGTVRTMQAAISISAVTAVVAGPSAAADMQTAVLMNLARCGESSHSSSSASAFRALTPLATNDSAAGALAGNAIAAGVLGTLLVAAFLVFYVVQRKSLLQAMAGARIPNFLLLLFAALHPSTVLVSARLAESQDAPHSVAAGVVALLFCVGIPVAVYVAAHRVHRRFVAYDIAPGSRYASFPWRMAVPVGLVLPNEKRLMLSTVITSSASPCPLYSLVPFVSSFSANFPALLPHGTSTWLCVGSMCFSAFVHLLLAGVSLLLHPSRHRVANAFSGFGFLILAALQVQRVAGRSSVTGAAEALLLLQGALSIGRCVLAIVIKILEIRLSNEPTIEMTRVLWEIPPAPVARVASAAVALAPAVLAPPPVLVIPALRDSGDVVASDEDVELQTAVSSDEAKGDDPQTTNEGEGEEEGSSAQDAMTGVDVLMEQLLSGEDGLGEACCPPPLQQQQEERRAAADGDEEGGSSPFAASAEEEEEACEARPAHESDLHRAFRERRFLGSPVTARRTSLVADNAPATDADTAFEL